MSRRFMSVLFLFGFLFSSSTLFAADALDAISSDASVVVRLRNPKATIDKVAAFVDMVQPGIGAQVRQNAMAIGIAISNPSLAGVDMNGDWFMAVYATGPQTEPGIVFVVPGTDLKAMKGALGEGIKFHELDKWGAYTTHDGASEKTAARIKGTGKSISSVIDKESIVSLEKSDLGVFINVAQIVGVFKNELKMAREQVGAALQNLPPQAAPGIDPAVVTKLLTDVVGALLQGVEDTKSCSIALQVSKQGLAIEDIVRVNPGTDFDKFLQKSPPSALEAVTGLPAGNSMYAGITWDMTSLMKFASKFTDLIQADADAKKELAAGIEEASKLKFGTIATAFGLGNLKEGALRSVSVYEVTPTAKYRELMQSQMKLAGLMKTPGLKQTFDVKKDAEKFGANSADVISYKMELEDANNPGADMLQKFMQALYGPEGMTVRVVSLKDRVVQTSGGGKEAMTKALSTIESKPTPSPALDAARKQLAPKANAVFLIDLPGLVATAAKAAADSQMLPIPIDPAMIEGLQLKESYIGFSIGTEPQGIRSNTHIPVEQVQGLARIGILVFTLMQRNN